VRLLSVRLIVSLIVGITLVSGLSAYYEVQTEKSSRRRDLERRAEVLGESLAGNVERSLEKGAKRDLPRIVERFGNREHLVGIAIYDELGNSLASSPGLAKRLTNTPLAIDQAITQNHRDGTFVSSGSGSLHIYTLPLHRDDEVIGVFDLESDQLNAYDDDDLQVLLLLASQVAIIIEKVMLHEQLVEKKRIEGQLEVARQVQLELLPGHDPHIEGFDISAYNFPTEEVSGDYYDWVRIYDDQIGIVVADVSGKGVPAALLMAFLRASLRSAIHVGYAPNVSMAKVNYLLWESIERNQFVTAFYGVLDATNKTLAYTNAGHNPPLLMDSDGTTRYIERGGLPLGMFKDTRYYEYYLAVEPGQILVLYTDGVTEATSPDGEEYGRERLENTVRQHRELRSRDLINFLHKDIMSWTGSIGAGDDITFFIIKAENEQEGAEGPATAPTVSLD